MHKPDGVWQTMKRALVSVCTYCALTKTSFKPRLQFQSVLVLGSSKCEELLAEGVSIIRDFPGKLTYS